MTPSTRRRLSVHRLIFLGVFLSIIAVTAVLTHRYPRQFDLTAAGRNSISESSTKLLEAMGEPIEVIAYASPDRLIRDSVRTLIDRYRRIKPDITLQFVDPAEVPDDVRKLGITVDGELIVKYNDRSEHVQSLTEFKLTNALNGLARAELRWVAYLTGHGERDLLGERNFDLGTFSGQLDRRGFKVRDLNLAEAGAIPDNVSVLVVTQPVVPWLDGEVRQIQSYIEKGGNLLWLAEPEPQGSLTPIANELGISFISGVVVDPETQTYGIQNPAFVVATNYGPHPITQSFDLLTVFPLATGITTTPRQGWTIDSILSTATRAWSERSTLRDDVRFDPATDVKGPLDIAIALTREVSPDANTKPQRIVVIGDGDFLSNAYLGNGGNLELGMRLFNWLAGDESLIEVPAKIGVDQTFAPSRLARTFIALGAPLTLPLLFFGTGMFVWWRRRRR